MLFNPHNDEELAAKIKSMINKEYHDNIDHGLKDMYERAKIYSREFEQLLSDNGKKL